MWTPNQHLNEATLKTLREAGFSDLKLEFLGWQSGRAGAINRSKNPVKAAHTLLASDKTQRWLDTFMERKKESVRPKERAEHDEADRKFNKLEKWVEQVNADAEQSREEEPTV